MADQIINITNNATTVIGAGDIAYINGFSGRFSAKIKNGVLILKNKDTKAVITIGVATGSKIAFLNGSATIDLAAGTIGGKKPGSFSKATFDATLTSENTFYAAVPFALTKGVDAFTGTKLNDTINAFADDNNLSTNDQIDGGAGTDTLNVYMTGGHNTSFPEFATVKGVEIVNLLSDGSDTFGCHVDASKFEGVQQLWQKDAAANVINLAATTTAGFRNIDLYHSVATATGVTTANIALDKSTGHLDTIGATTVTVTGTKSEGEFELHVTETGDAAAIKVTTAVATTLDYDDTDVKSIDASASTGDITMLGTADDELAADVAFKSGSGKDSVVLDTTTSKAIDLGAGNDTLTINASSLTGSLAGNTGTDTLVMSAANAAAATASATTQAAFADKITGFEILSLGVSDTTPNTINLARLNNMSTIKSAGTGAAAISVAAATLPVLTQTQGTGSVPESGAYAFGSATYVTGQFVTISGVTVTVTGTGTYTAAQMVSVFTGGTVAGLTRTGLYVLPGSGGGSWATINTSAIEGGTTLLLSNSSNGNKDDAPAATGNSLTSTAATALTIDNLASGGTFELTGNNDGGLTINVKDAASGASDVLNLTLTNSGVLTGGTVTVANVETVNIATDDLTTVPNGDVDTLTLVADAAKSVKVSGDAGLNLTFTGTKMTSFDASGVSKGAVTLTTGALESAATIKGGNDGNTVNFSAATKAVTFTGGDGADTVTANGQANSITTGKGADTVTVGNGNNTISTGDDVDTVTLGTGNNTVNLGAGDDVLHLGTGLNTVTLGAGSDTVYVATTANGNIYTTIADIAKGDVLDFVGSSDASSAVALGSAITLANTASFSDFLDAANDSSADITWFQYQGNTYVVSDNNQNAGTFDLGTDAVIKLTGLVDLSTSTVTSGAVTIV